MIDMLPLFQGIFLFYSIWSLQPLQGIKDDLISILQMRKLRSEGELDLRTGFFSDTKYSPILPL